MRNCRKARTTLSIPLAVMVLFCGRIARASGTAAGTTIPNTAAADYLDSAGAPQPRVTSPTCSVQVSQIAGVSISPTSGTTSEKPGATACFAVTITNNGNGNDTLTLAATDQQSWGAKVIRDDNADGTHQPGETTVLSSTGSLAADATTRCFLAVTIPAGTAATATDMATLTVTSTADASRSATATVSVSVKAPAYGPVWVVPTKGPVAGSVTVANGVAFVGSDDNNLYAIAATPDSGYTPGTVLWTFATNGPVRGRPFVTFDNNGAVTMIYVTSDDGYVYGLDPFGGLKWVTMVAEPGSFLHSAPALARGLLYVPAGNAIVALDPATGRKVLTSPALAGASLTSPIAIPNLDSVVTVSDNGYIYSLDTRMTGIRWFAHLGAPVVSAPVYIGGQFNQLLIATQGGQIYNLDADKGTPNTNWAQRGYVTVDGGVDGSLYVDPRGLLYFGTANHRLYAMNITDGSVASPAWPRTPAGSGDFQSSALVFPDDTGIYRLYIGGMDGKFHAAPADNPMAEAVYDTQAGFVGSPSASGRGPSDVVVIGGTDGNIYAFPLR